MIRLCAWLGVVMSVMVSNSSAEESGKTYFYSGGYTQQLTGDAAAQAGVALWSLDTKTGAMTQEAGPWPLVNPSYLVLTPKREFLYSVNEVADFEGTKDGSLTAYSVDAKTHALRPLGAVSANGPIPAYISVDATGKYLVSANYTGGNVCVYPIQADGSLGEATANVQHSGTSVDAGRQTAPHPHSAVVSPDNKYVFVPDLGLDIIKAYAFDAKSGTLTPAPKLDVSALKGTGPRHLTFHPSGKFAFCSLEMGNRVVSYRYADGHLTKVGDYSSVPDDLEGKSYTSEVGVSPNGKFVYIANRGHDSIAGFKLDDATGELERIQIAPLKGDWPRYFAIDPSGTIMVVADQKSDTFESFYVDADTGLLSSTGQVGAFPAPAFVCFK